MMDGINTLPPAELERELYACCASSRWVRSMVDARPWLDPAAIDADARRHLADLSFDEWADAVRAQGDWPVPPCDEGTRRAAHVALQLYRDRFGYPFVSAHENMTGEQLLMRIRIRLGHEEAAELRKSRWEHGNVVCRRLQRLASALAGQQGT
jgi:2-oxo-4-hydroxy-4-carboxy-5-ureidoimidazoline decarboxylase